MSQGDDGLIRELPRIARYAAKNADDDWRFRNYLKAGLDTSNRALDQVVRELNQSVSAAIDCTTCAHCCRHLQVVLDSRDIARLAKRLDLTTKEFTERYVGVAEDGVQHFKSAPCPLLGDDNRCTVYDERPTACRDFPYLDKANFRSRTITMVENIGFCPIVFNVWTLLKQRYRRPTSPRRR